MSTYATYHGSMNNRKKRRRNSTSRGKVCVTVGSVTVGAAAITAGGGDAAGSSGVTPGSLINIGAAVSPEKVDPFTVHEEWRKTAGTVLARCMEEAFSGQTNGGPEHGMAGDYLVQNDAGDQCSIEARTFLKLYERWS